MSPEAAFFSDSPQQSAPSLSVVGGPVRLKHKPTPPPPREDPWDYSWDAFFPLSRKLPPPRSPYEDQRLGVRQYTYLDEQGQKHFDQIGLTPEDFLDPWPGDKPVGSIDHAKDILRIMLTILRFCQAIWQDFVVSTDLKVIFEREDLTNNPCPDVAVIVGIPKSDQNMLSSCKLISLGAQIPILFEVVSPKDSETRENDIIDKVEIYEQAGIPYYVIVDVPKYRERTTRKPAMRMLDIVVYRLDEEGTYLQMDKDEQGRVLLPPMNLLIGKTETDEPGIECVAFFDPNTGEQLEDPIEFVGTADAKIRDALEQANTAKQAAEAAEKKVKTAAQAAEKKIKAAQDQADAAKKAADAALNEAKAAKEAKDAAEAALDALNRDIDRQVQQRLDQLLPERLAQQAP